MKHEFHVLEKSVIEKLSITSFCCQSFTPEELHSWHESVKEEMMRIETAIRYQVFNQGNRRQLAKYISGNQAAMVRLLNHLHTVFASTSNISPTDSQHTMLQVGQQLAYNMEDLLGYLAEDHPDLFNFNQYGSAFFHQRVAKIFSQKVEPVKQYMEKNVDYPAVVALILKPYQEIIQTSLRKYSYWKIKYLNALLEQLQQLVDKKLTDSELGMELFMTLIYMNYNPTNLFVACSRLIAKQCYQHETIKQQLHYLHLVRKTIVQVMPAPNVAYKPERPSLQKQLKQWISQEITYLHIKTDLNNITSLGIPVTEEKIEKLHTNLSVAQLACMLKIYMETNAIKNPNLSEVIRSFVKLVRTDKSREISEDSLRTKFYNLERSTCDRVKELLRRQLNYLDEL